MASDNPRAIPEADLVQRFDQQCQTYFRTLNRAEALAKKIWERNDATVQDVLELEDCIGYFKEHPESNAFFSEQEKGTIQSLEGYLKREWADVSVLDWFIAKENVESNAPIDESDFLIPGKVLDGTVVPASGILRHGYHVASAPEIYQAIRELGKLHSESWISTPLTVADDTECLHRVNDVANTLQLLFSKLLVTSSVVSGWQSVPVMQGYNDSAFHVYHGNSEPVACRILGLNEQELRELRFTTAAGDIDLLAFERALNEEGKLRHGFPLRFASLPNLQRLLSTNDDIETITDALNGAAGRRLEDIEVYARYKDRYTADTKTVISFGYYPEGEFVISCNTPLERVGYVVLVDQLKKAFADYQAQKR